MAVRRSLRLPTPSQLGMLLPGLFLFALGIVLTLRAGLGLGPWDVLHQGLSMKLPISFGQAGILVGAGLIVVSALLKEYPGAGTVLNMLLIGSLIDVILWAGLVPDLSRANALVQLLTDVSGVALMGVGSALYIKAGLGAGPRDSIMLAVRRISGMRVGVVRTGIELTALLAGYLLGGTIGIGTLIFALGIGFAVETSFKLLNVQAHRE